MTNSISHAYFNSYAEASRAIADLQTAGADRGQISVFGHKDGEIVNADGNSIKGEVAKDVAGKAALGSGVGALLGVAALAIPGVGPFVAAGAIAEAAIGGAAVAGTAVGAVSGGVAGAFQDYGIPSEHSEFYAKNLENGGALVTVERDEDRAKLIDDVLYRDGGYSATHRKAA